MGPLISIQFVAVPATQCLPVPRALSLIEAASLPETFFTVWGNIFVLGRLKAGETVLIHGGSRCPHCSFSRPRVAWRMERAARTAPVAPHHRLSYPSLQWNRHHCDTTVQSQGCARHRYSGSCPHLRRSASRLRTGRQRCETAGLH